MVQWDLSDRRGFGGVGWWHLRAYWGIKKRETVKHKPNEG